MMGQEKSLNSPIKDGEADEWQDWLVDENLDQELLLSQKQEFDENLIWEQLKTCYDPEIPVNVVDLGLIYDLSYEQSKNEKFYVKIKMTLTAPGCGMGPTIAADV